MAKMLVVPETELHYKWPNIEVIDIDTLIHTFEIPMQIHIHTCKLETNKQKMLEKNSKNKIHTTNVTFCFHYY